MKKIKIIDPLELSRDQIDRHRWQIIWKLRQLGRSRKSAVASADRWEKSLRKTQIDFIGFKS